MSIENDLFPVDLKDCAGFADVARNVAWQGDTQPANLCVVWLPNLCAGFLALSAVPDVARTEQTPITDVLLFTGLHSEWSQLSVPSSIADVAMLTGEGPSLDTSHLAKGIGVLGFNTAGAQASHYGEETAAVRAVRLEEGKSLGDVYVGQSYNPWETAMRGARHKLELWRANRGDAMVANGGLPTTEQVLNEKAALLKGCACAFLALSAVNVAEQRVLFPPQKVRGAYLLANGRATKPLEPLRKIGTAQVPKPRNRAAAEVLNLLRNYI